MHQSNWIPQSRCDFWIATRISRDRRASKFNRSAEIFRITHRLFPRNEVTAVFMRDELLYIDEA